MMGLFPSLILVSASLPSPLFTGWRLSLNPSFAVNFNGNGKCFRNFHVFVSYLRVNLLIVIRDAVIVNFLNLVPWLLINNQWLRHTINKNLCVDGINESINNDNNQRSGSNFTFSFHLNCCLNSVVQFFVELLIVSFFYLKSVTI